MLHLASFAVNTGGALNICDAPVHTLACATHWCYSHASKRQVLYNGRRSRGPLLWPSGPRSATDEPNLLWIGLCCLRGKALT
jgi:hypothetical protein